MTRQQKTPNDPKKKTTEGKVKKIPKTDDGLRGFWNNIKQTNIHIFGVPERKESKK